MKIISPIKIYVSISKIPGAERGVFANVDIKKGETLEICPIIELIEHDANILGESTLANYFYFFGEKKERLLVALGFGSIYNHTYSPNAVYKIKPEEQIIEFTASEDIKKDEEITVNYNQESANTPKLWFEN